MQHKRGILISFEGLDGSGKTTQIDLLGKWLRQQGINHLTTCEPGGTPLGCEIYHILFDQRPSFIDPLAELFLFLADRAQHFSQFVLPTLERGISVISDRCIDSGMAYQGAFLGLNRLIDELNVLVTREKEPDLTILLDLPVEQALLREKMAHHGANRQDPLFYQRVRSAYLTLAQKHKSRIKIVNASYAVNLVHDAVVELVKQALECQNENMGVFGPVPDP